MTPLQHGGRSGARAPLLRRIKGFDYIYGKPQMPVGKSRSKYCQWSQLSSDADAVFDKHGMINCHDLEPKARGISPIKQVPSPTRPFPEQEINLACCPALEKALQYMGLTWLACC